LSTRPSIVRYDAAIADLTAQMNGFAENVSHFQREEQRFDTRMNELRRFMN